MKIFYFCLFVWGVLRFLLFFFFWLLFVLVLFVVLLLLVSGFFVVVWLGVFVWEGEYVSKFMNSRFSSDLLLTRSLKPGLSKFPVLHFREKLYVHAYIQQ